MKELINYGILTNLRNFNKEEFTILNQREIESFDNKIKIITIQDGVLSERIEGDNFQIKLNRYIDFLDKEAVKYSLVENLLKIYIGNYIHKQIIEGKKIRNFLLDEKTKRYNLSEFILKLEGVI